MRIVTVTPSFSSSIEVILPFHDLEEVDPRHYFGGRRPGYKFRFSVRSGRILTITRTDKDTGWDHPFRVRLYLSTEDIPDFTSTVYTYHGLYGEQAPYGTTEIIFHPSVTSIIKIDALHSCTRRSLLVRVTIPVSVTHIEDGACFLGLYILCANPHGTGDAIRAYLQLAPEAAEREDSDGMTNSFPASWQEWLYFLRWS